MFRLAAMAFVLISTQAEATPIYLRCQFDPALDENHRATMDVTLDESEGTATWRFAQIERDFSGKAAFLAGSVRFAGSTIGGDPMSGFTIDRTNLTLFDRKMTPPAQPITAQTRFTYRSVPVGKCALVQETRAF